MRGSSAKEGTKCKGSARVLASVELEKGLKRMQVSDHFMGDSKSAPLMQVCGWPGTACDSL